MVGVTSFDPEPQGYGECSIQTSVAYYRDWILKTMAGKTPPSKCNVKEWPPLPSDPHLCEKCEVGPVLSVTSHISILVAGSTTCQNTVLDANAHTRVVFCRSVPKKSMSRQRRLHLRRLLLRRLLHTRRLHLRKHQRRMLRLRLRRRHHLFCRLGRFILQKNYTT